MATRWYKGTWVEKKGKTNPQFIPHAIDVKVVGTHADLLGWLKDHVYTKAVRMTIQEVEMKGGEAVGEEMTWVDPAYKAQVDAATTTGGVPSDLDLGIATTPAPDGAAATSADTAAGQPAPAGVPVAPARPTVPSTPPTPAKSVAVPAAPATTPAKQ